MTKLDRREYVIDGIYINDNGNRVRLEDVRYNIVDDNQLAHFIEPSGAAGTMPISEFLDEYVLEEESEKPLATEAEPKWYEAIRTKAGEIGDEALHAAKVNKDNDRIVALASRIAILTVLITEACDFIAAIG